MNSHLYCSDHRVWGQLSTRCTWCSHPSCWASPLIDPLWAVKPFCRNRPFLLSTKVTLAAVRVRVWDVPSVLSVPLECVFCLLRLSLLTLACCVEAGIIIQLLWMHCTFLVQDLTDNKTWKGHWWWVWPCLTDSETGVCPYPSRGGGFISSVRAGVFFSLRLFLWLFLWKMWDIDKNELV